MLNTPDNSSTLVKDGEGPFYTEDSSLPTNTVKNSVMPYTDVNTVLGLATRAQLINSNIVTISGGVGGVVPVNTIPGSATSGAPKVMSFLSGTLAYLKANHPVGIALAMATDAGPAGALYLYINNPAFGDSGWFLLAGG